MNFEKIEEYLSGGNFSNGLEIKFPINEKKILYRLEYLKELATGKKVLHIGCIDHLPIYSTKVDKGIWLHKHLLDVASFCAGLDINMAGIDFLKDQGYTNLFYMDILKDDVPSELLKEHYDLVVLGEVIEHIDNPVDFLKRLHEKFHPIADRIIITTPNAFAFKNIKNAFRNKEFINSDHRFWFTPYTLTKIAVVSGFKPELFQFVHHQNLTTFAIIQKILLRFIPTLRSTCVLILRF